MTPHGDPSDQDNPTHDPAPTRSEHAPPGHDDHTTTANDKFRPDTGWTLSTTETDDDYAPTFLGNGYFGGRIPAAGTGYATTPIETQAHLAGFFAQDGPVEQYANIPTWSTLAFSDESGTYGRLPQAARAGEQDDPEQGAVSDYRQTLDLRAGLLTTQATWTSPAGRRTDLTYQVLVHQARHQVAAVQLTFTPHWSGSARVSGVFDGTSARLTERSCQGYDGTAAESYETVTTLGTGITAALASRLELPTGVAAHVTEFETDQVQSVGVQATFDVEAGSTYTVTKYVGVASSQDCEDPLSAARAAVAAAADTGYRDLLAEHKAAWDDLWRADIEILGDPVLQLQVRASMFYLLESTRAGVNWSLSPCGLSGDGYNGHVFWDTETWMYPALLAQHPDIAAGMNTYRQQRLAAAQEYATRTGFEGARFPWESALHGDEQTPPGWEMGDLEHHITADIALAHWQYYLATGDRDWLAEKAWPVLKGAAEFWASSAVPNDAGGYDIKQVMGPDEYHFPVDNSVYTNVAAAETLRIATRAAKLVGVAAAPEWDRVADGLKVPYDEDLGIHPQYDGYDGDTIKQADVVMLQYPWEHPMPAEVARNDLDYYVPRTDPDGPSMTDSIHSIAHAALGTPGSAAYDFMRRSVDPFIRGPFNQFAEGRHGGAFTFTTGQGGFLQVFLYGFTGMRWREDRLRLDPTLPPQLDGLTLRRILWQGREFDIGIGPEHTTITLTGGLPTQVEVAGTTHPLRQGAPLILPTRRPDLLPTSDLAGASRRA
jgi:trehalose/maltose hydrolase-like predicted phosphorylase